MELFFGPEEAHEVSEMDQRSPDATMGVGRAPYLVAASGTPLTCSRLQHLLYIPKLPERNLDR